MHNGKYIYAIIRKPVSGDFGIFGIGRESVRTCSYKNLAVVVSDSPIIDYPITRQNTVTHQQVIEYVMERHAPVLPVSFGTVAESEKVIKSKLVESRYDELCAALENLEGKVELNIKAMWLDMGKVFSEILKKDVELKQQRDALQGVQVSRNDAIEIGKRVVEAISKERAIIQDAILSRLNNLIVDYKETDLLGEQMIFNLALLAPLENEVRIDKIVRHLDEEYKNGDVYFKYIAPLPPFNFVKVNLALY